MFCIPFRESTSGMSSGMLRTPRSSSKRGGRLLFRHVRDRFW
jgi:hypothetical protein